MPPTSYVFRVILMTLILALSGCDPFSAPGSTLDEYVRRVARVLDESVQLSEVALPEPLPRHRQRLRDVPSLKLGMLDFLSLYGCELQSLVGQRNSGLGRVMHPGSRLVYDIHFIAESRACLATLNDADLAHTLRQAVAFKWTVLPRVTWNATWGSEEMGALFTYAKGPLPLALPADAVANLRLDLDRYNQVIRSLAAGQLPGQLDSLDEIYQRWQAQYLAGQLLRSAHLLTVRLNEAADLVQQRLDGHPLCVNQRPNNAACTVKSFFFGVYADRVQPYMAEVQKVRQALLPELQQLALAQQSQWTPAFRSFYAHSLAEQGKDSQWQALDRAMARHTKVWQKLLEQCGMRPGQ